jgi:hypothetical protein
MINMNKHQQKNNHEDSLLTEKDIKKIERYFEKRK